MSREATKRQMSEDDFTSVTEVGNPDDTYNEYVNKLEEYVRLHQETMQSELNPDEMTRVSREAFQAWVKKDHSPSGTPVETVSTNPDTADQMHQTDSEQESGFGAENYDDGIIPVAKNTKSICRLWVFLPLPPLT